MTRHHHAQVAGAALPTKSEGPTVAAVAPLENKQDNKPDFHGARQSVQALRVIEGSNKAAQYLARLQAQQADPDELALIVAALYDASLRGFCSAIAKALGVRHG